MLSFKNKKVGIWGFGLVGKSALRYFHERGAICTIIDQRTLNHDEQYLAQQYNASIWQRTIETFLAAQDYIMPSPGIDISAYKKHFSFLCELDLFTQEWHKPIIAVTGTVGKTSLTTLLAKLIEHAKHVIAAGNIGTPMLDILNMQQNLDVAVLELSSWQLEHAQQFAPDIACWTNLYANHLDRHNTLEEYFNAKAQILMNQNEHQAALVPLQLWQQITDLKLRSETIWIHPQKPEAHYFNQCKTLFYTDKKQVILWHNNQLTPLMATSALSSTTFIENWLYALATLWRLGMPLELSKTCSLQLEHRLEPVRSFAGVTFINDSKGTTIEATLAAIRQYASQRIILLLGGTSKGVDRSALIMQIPASVVLTICFGKEATQLKAMCDDAGIASIACTNMQAALASALQQLDLADIVLFSPSGASFDLYANYQERGNHFKQLVGEL